MVVIEARGITKSFEEVVALDRVSLTTHDGEMFTLLGPSGCGKTTFLRCVAGFEYPEEGSIFFDAVEVTNRPPYKRETGMVFQNYALWPHMTVYDNVAYGLKVRKVPKGETNARIREVLKMVHLEGMEKRTPHQLSGGQQQRIALARALVVNPKVLLFDEPLSNLDAKLRVDMRAEIKRIQGSLGITTIYVTHDQEEAMSISDRIAILNEGRLEQLGSPVDIYFRPESSFIADFIGQGTFLQGQVVSRATYLRVALDDGEEIEAVPSNPSYEPQPGDKVLIAIRPESFAIGDGGKGNAFRCEVYHVAFLGKTRRILARRDGQKFVIEADPHSAYREGERIRVRVDPEQTLAIRAEPS
ncbi:MAG: ABC transporter ATP-binding protein [Candidatus Geothermarchaeales archaeon]